MYAFILRNISGSKHIDDLTNLVHALEEPFNIIGITETRLHDNNALVNVDIDLDTCPQVCNVGEQEYTIKSVMSLT